MENDPLATHNGFERRGGSLRKRMPPALVLPLVLLLISPGAIFAADGSAIAVYSDGRGGFGVMGNNLNRITGGEIRIDYHGEEQAPPGVSGVSGGAAVEVTGETPGSLTIRFKAGKPISGHALLATARIPGTVTFSSAWLRNDRGSVETPAVKVTNPTEEQLAALKERRKVREAALPPPSETLPQATSEVAAVAESLGASVVTSPAHGSPPALAVTERRPSVLELFWSYTGERGHFSLARLFDRRDEMFLQEPPVLLSDGKMSLSLSVRSGALESPRFLILGAECTGFARGEDGTFVLEIVPARGSMASSVTVLSGELSIEFPLAVAPPSQLYTGGGGDAVEAEYVAVANRIAQER